jgi:uncharacterized protein YycO
MWLVRLGTFSRYGHAAVCTEASDGLAVTVVEAYPGGARARQARADEFVWSSLVLSEGQRRQIVEAAVGCLGLPYDWWDIARFLLRYRRGRLFGVTPDYADRRLICSELVVWCYRQAEVDLAPGRAPGAVSPGDLADWITRH